MHSFYCYNYILIYCSSYIFTLRCLVAKSYKHSKFLVLGLKVWFNTAICRWREYESLISKGYYVGLLVPLLPLPASAPRRVRMDRVSSWVPGSAIGECGRSFSSLAFVVFREVFAKYCLYARTPPPIARYEGFCRWLGFFVFGHSPDRWHQGLQTPTTSSTSFSGCYLHAASSLPLKGC